MVAKISKTSLELEIERQVFDHLLPGFIDRGYPEESILTEYNNWENCIGIIDPKTLDVVAIFYLQLSIDPTRNTTKELDEIIKTVDQSFKEIQLYVLSAAKNKVEPYKYLSKKHHKQKAHFVKQYNLPLYSSLTLKKISEKKEATSTNFKIFVGLAFTGVATLLILEWCGVVPLLSFERVILIGILVLLSLLPFFKRFKIGDFIEIERPDSKDK